MLSSVDKVKNKIIINHLGKLRKYIINIVALTILYIKPLSKQIFDP